MLVASPEEAYFLVRVGSWSEDDLERWVQKRISDKLDQVTSELYEEMYYEKKANETRGWTDNQGRW